MEDDSISIEDIEFGIVTTTTTPTTTTTTTTEAPPSPLTTTTTTTASGSISITNPIPSSVWFGGTSQTIQWTSVGLTGNVRIDLYYIGAFNRTIASTSNTGSYIWNIPSGSTSSDLYSIKIFSLTDETILDQTDNFSVVEID